MWQLRGWNYPWFVFGVGATNGITDKKNVSG